MIKMRTIWVTVYGLVLATILVGCSPSKQVQGRTESKSEPSPAIGKDSAILQKLHGQWKFDNSGQIIGFTNTGLIYSATPQKDGNAIGVEIGPYRLDVTKNPIQIEVEMSGQKIATLIEFDEPGKMRVLLRQDPRQPLPLSMPDNAIRFVKTSDIATAPQGMTAAKHNSLERESKNIVEIMNRYSQAFFFKNSKFPTSFSQLDIGFDSQSKNYHYDVKPIGNDGVQLLGTSKSAELRGYTGGIFILPTEKDRLTIVVICEAAKPGIGDLPAPKLVNNEPTCSEGTVNLSTIAKPAPPTQPNSQIPQTNLILPKQTR